MHGTDSSPAPQIIDFKKFSVYTGTFKDNAAAELRRGTLDMSGLMLQI